MMVGAFAFAILTARADTITAGNNIVAGSSLPLGTTTKQLVMQDSTGSRVVGTLTQVLSSATIGGRRGLLSVQTFAFGNRRTVDSSFADAATLAPILHRSRNESRTMSLDFHSAHVAGTITPAKGNPTTIDQPTSVATFDSNIADVVFAALPLAAAYSATVATYVHEEGGLVWNDVAVIGDETVNGQHVWHLRVHTPKRDVEYWITRTSREVVRSRYQIAPGRVLRIDRLP